MKLRSFDFPLYVLFGVILAVLIGGLLAVHHQAQVGAGVDAQAQALANSISKACFSSLPSHVLKLDLPLEVGGSSYKLGVENNVVVVEVVEGPRRGRKYYASVGVKLEVENHLPQAGGKLYIAGAEDRVLLSGLPLAPKPRELEKPLTWPKPEFYGWAKEHPIEAAGLLAAYVKGLKEFPQALDNLPLDVIAYEWRNDKLLVELGYPGVERSKWLLEGSEFLKGELENLEVELGLRLSSTLADGLMRISIPPAADAFVFGRMEHHNYNTRDLWVGTMDDAGLRAWIRFDLLAGENLVEAKLWIYFYGSEHGRGSPGGISVHHSAVDDWEENELTWANAPPFEREPTLVVEEFSTPGWRSFDLTSDVEQELGSGVSWCLKANVEEEYGQPDGVNLAWSKEGSKPPRLELVLRPYLYSNMGVFTSQPLDAGLEVEWGTISWSSAEPPQTSLELETRSSKDLSSWSEWERCSNGGEVPSPPGRYLQLRGRFGTENAFRTPVLHQVEITYQVKTPKFLVSFDFDSSGAGPVDNAWVVESLSLVEDNLQRPTSAPSLALADQRGWLYLPSEVATYLRQRTWELENGSIIPIPENLYPTPSAVSVNGRFHCAYGLGFWYQGSAYKVYFRALPTDPGENVPGFTFASEPPLKPRT